LKTISWHCACLLVAVFAWEAYEKGTDAHVQADPTKLELLAREFNKRKDTFIESKKESIVTRYGGEEHLDAPPKQLLLAQTVRQLTCHSVISFFNHDTCLATIVCGLIHTSLGKVDYECLRKKILE